MIRLRTSSTAVSRCVCSSSVRPLCRRDDVDPSADGSAASAPDLQNVIVRSGDSRTGHPVGHVTRNGSAPMTATSPYPRSEPGVRAGPGHAALRSAHPRPACAACVDEGDDQRRPPLERRVVDRGRRSPGPLPCSALISRRQASSASRPVSRSSPPAAESRRPSCAAAVDFRGIAARRRGHASRGSRRTTVPGCSRCRCAAACRSSGTAAAAAASGAAALSAVAAASLPVATSWLRPSPTAATDAAATTTGPATRTQRRGRRPGPVPRPGPSAGRPVRPVRRSPVTCAGTAPDPTCPPTGILPASTGPASRPPGRLAATPSRGRRRRAGRSPRRRRPELRRRWASEPVRRRPAPRRSGRRRPAACRVRQRRPSRPGRPGPAPRPAPARRTPRPTPGPPRSAGRP